ncbi:MAG: extracellular solute-binding protein [Christensenellales bacterium]|jgi:putative aldouronate transport system substrate-binding protein
MRKASSISLSRLMSALIVISMLVAALSACAAPKTPPASQTPAPDTTPSASATGGIGGIGGGEFSYPMAPTTLTINYADDPYDLSNIEPHFHEHFWWNEYEARTGVRLEAIGGNSGAFDVTEQFLLLLASGRYPDLMMANWVNFPGGPNAGMGDGYIIPLNDYTGFFPGLMKVYAENPDWYKRVQTDEGVLYNFPYLRGDPDAHTETGMVVRQDWMDALDMQIPTTIDELTEVMRAMKEAHGLASAFTFEMRWLWLEWASSGLSSAFGVAYPFFVVDDMVKFGPLEPGYRDFMAQMAAWYSDGLLDQDFPSINKATVQSKFASGDVGVSIQQLNNVIGCIEANEGTDYAVAGIPSFVDPSTGTAMFSHFYQTYDGSFGVGISTQCQKIEEACRFMDYLYTDEGRLFASYGMEGLSYEIVDGAPQFTDILWNNPGGSTPGTVRGRYTKDANYPAIRDAFTGHMHDYAREIHGAWVNENMASYVYPATTFTAVESSLVARYYNTINTYCQESIAQFITGQKNTQEDFDAFLTQLESYNVATVLEMYQAAYDRFNAR